MCYFHSEKVAGTLSWLWYTMSQPTLTTRDDCLRTAQECRAYLHDSYSKIDKSVDILSQKITVDCQSVLQKELVALQEDIASVKKRVMQVIGTQEKTKIHHAGDE